MLRNSFRALLAGSLLVGAASAALAADGDRGWTVRVGIGPQFVPKYPGADEIRLIPLAAFSLRHTGDPIPFGDHSDSAGIAVITSGGFKMGPVVNLSASRKPKDVGAPVDKVSTTIEAGGFAQYFFSPSFRVRTELRHGIGGHDGLIGSVSADLIARDRDKYIFYVGPRVLYSDKRYERAYFGVSPAAAAASGLPAYSPSAGFHAVGASTGLLYQFTYHWGITSYAHYDRLIRDAAHSPIVRTYGSRNQWSAGAALIYTFDVGKLF